ncbi:T9SS type A sorting domain-containing protein [Cecembia sp.]|uniref:T9SS type A sorting domain-containing protein n=1 Tax=Cecembia sp. TaxID=1898110 RepID=UPI0025C558BC|nr:T9SS type A sorting domain-containing protein [Cecembia sp.]
MKYLLLLLFIFQSFSLQAQQVFSFDQSIPVEVNGVPLVLPFAAGVNTAQFQEMDTNGDGKEELIVWDINSRRILVFENTDSGFQYLPEMAYFFPEDINGFLVLADYDGDGKKDLFTSSPFGIKAYRNISPAGAAFPVWEVGQNFLRLDNGSNVQANVLDIPLIMDIDGDGDLDIVAFNFVVGDYLELYRNTSVERKGIPDIDGFAFPQSRWGNFEFCNCGDFSFGFTCGGIPISEAPPIDGSAARIQHAGGHSVLYADFNEDGIFDLLLGRDECDILYFLPNEGSNSQPEFRSFSTTLPDYGTLPQFPIFHAAYLKGEQLLVSSNSSSVAGVFNADYARNVFSLSKGIGDAEPFLQSDMLDLGENTRPFFKGFKDAGEMILTANSKFGGKVLGIAYQFIKEEDVFRLVEKDYLGLSQLDFTDLQYQEYQTASGQNTYWISGVDTVNFRLERRIFVGTQADIGAMVELTVPVTGTRPLDHVEPFSFENRDYVLLAKQSGELVLFSLDLEGEARLKLDSRDFLGFQDNPASRNLSVHVLQGQKPSLYAIDQRGVLVFIENFMEQNQRQTIQLRLNASESSQSRFGRNTWISALSMPFGEGHDLIFGNTAGGLEYLKGIEGSLPPSSEDFLVRVYPNPTIGDFRVLSSKNARMRLVNMPGQVIIDNVPIQANRVTDIDGFGLAPGVYVLQFVSDGQQKLTRKLLVR